MSTLVIIPTYNEATTIRTAVAGVRRYAPHAHVLVVDDASPDGTGDIADELAAADDAVDVLHRTGKDGLGRAYVDGFRLALEREYEFVVEMDADGSHRPVDLPKLLRRAAADDAPDLVIGSRWRPGGAVENWPTHREVLSRGGNFYVRAALGVPVADATAGFRVFRASMLRALDLDSIESQGYCFQVDMTWRVHQAGGHIVEVPIVFVERTEGVSKMNSSIVREALARTTVWGAQHRLRQARRLAGRAGGRLLGLAGGLADRVEGSRRRR